MKTQNRMKRSLLFIIHFIGWAIVLLMPIFLEVGSEQINWSQYLSRLLVPICFLAIFYFNYFYLIDKYLFKRKIKEYIFINILLLIGLSVGIHIYHESNRKKRLEITSTSFHKIEEIGERNLNSDSTFIKDNPKDPRGKGGGYGPIMHPDLLPNKAKSNFHNAGSMFFLLLIFRSFFSLLLVVGLAVAIKITGRWYEDEAARNKLEKSNTEAELKNLKNQINPHFLLNTLNNIYALISFDADKAQQAVQDLSKMLRYILYENQEEYVPIQREMEFIQNYIELMKIRLTNNVSVSTTFNIPRTSSICIAPLIFISLIENAFKHGISPTEHSFIDILIEETKEKKIICRITNSYYPKSETDKSGSGIGLEQVSKRLQLLYQGRYIWHKGVSEDGKEYSSLLIISPIEADGHKEKTTKV